MFQDITVIHLFANAHQRYLIFADTKKIAPKMFKDIVLRSSFLFRIIDINHSNYYTSRLNCAEAFALLMTTPYAINQLQTDIEFFYNAGNDLFMIKKWFNENTTQFVKKHGERYAPLIEYTYKYLARVGNLLCHMRESPEMKNKPVCMSCYKLDRREFVSLKSTRNNGVPIEYSGQPVYVRAKDYTKKKPTYELCWNSYCSKCQQSEKQQYN